MVNAAKLGSYNKISVLDWIALQHEAFDRRRQLAHIADQPIGFEIGDGNFGVSEFDADHGNAGAARHADIRSGIAYHDRGGELSPCARDRLPQYRGVGFGDTESVRAANGRKPRTQSETVEQQLRRGEAVVHIRRRRGWEIPEIE